MMDGEREGNREEERICDVIYETEGVSETKGEGGGRREEQTRGGGGGGGTIDGELERNIEAIIWGEI